MLFISILCDKKAEVEKEKLQYLKMVKLKIPCGRKSELVVLSQVLINPFCGLSVIFCGFISHLIGRKAINTPEIFSGIHSFTGKTVNLVQTYRVVSAYPVRGSHSLIGC